MFKPSINEADGRLLTAVTQGSVAEVLQQLSQDANVNCRDAKMGKTPLWLACDAGRADHVEVLLGAGADVHAKTFPYEKYQIWMGGSTALHQAAMHGHAKVVQSLLAYGADTNATTADGDSPLMCAASDGHAEVVKQLVAHGADVTAKNKGRTALEAALYWKKQEVVNILLDHQLRVQAGSDGKSLPRIQSMPREARTAQAKPKPIHRSCSDTKAEQDKCYTPCTHESPKKAPAPTCSYVPVRAHARGSVSEYSSAKQAGKALDTAQCLSRSAPDKATRFEGKAEKACRYVPSKAHTQDSASDHSSGKQAVRAVNMSKAQPRSNGKATRSEGKAELACESVPEPEEAAQWEMLGAQLAPATYSFYSTEASAIAEDVSLGVAGIIWEVFQQFTGVGQELAASAGFVPGLYLVAVGLKLLGYIMRANQSADELTQRLYSLSCSIVKWLDSLLPKAAKNDSILLRVEKLLTPLAFVLRDVKSFIEKQPGTWAPSRLFTAGSRQATARALQDKLEEFLKELQLAGFLVNLDTRHQVQKLQHEVMQCTHELSSLQGHLKTGFAEVKEKIDDSQDRMQTQLARVLQEVQWLGLRLDPKTEAKSQELMHEAAHMDPVQQQKLLATVLWEAQEALDNFAATRHHAEVLQRTADDNGWDRCGICCEALALEGDMKPRFLPCQHVLCSSCLVQCCSDGLVTCPWCREVHRPKFLVAVDGDITCAADGFPPPLMQMQYLENRVKYARGLQA